MQTCQLVEDHAVPRPHPFLGSHKARRAHLALELSDKVVELKVVTRGIARKHTPVSTHQSSKHKEPDWYTAAQQVDD